MEHGAESREPREGTKDKHRTSNTERRTSEKGGEWGAA
jgi:hypothetical protein